MYSKYWFFNSYLLVSDFVKNYDFCGGCFSSGSCVNNPKVTWLGRP